MSPVLGLISRKNAPSAGSRRTDELTQAPHPRVGHLWPSNVWSTNLSTSRYRLDADREIS